MCRKFEIIVFSFKDYSIVWWLITCIIVAHTNRPPPTHTHTHGAMDDNKYMYNCWYIPLVTHTIHALAKGNNSNKITVSYWTKFIRIPYQFIRTMTKSRQYNTVMFYKNLHSLHIFRKELCKEIMYSIVIYCRIIFNHLVHGVNVRG